MDSRFSPEQAETLTRFTPDHTAMDIQRVTAEARRLRDDALARQVKGLFAGIGTVLGTLGEALASWPRRRRTYETLRTLTDRELADIGMDRADITRVFEPDFVLPGRAANANAANGNATGAPKAA